MSLWGALTYWNMLLEEGFLYKMFCEGVSELGYLMGRDVSLQKLVLLQQVVD